MTKGSCRKKTLMNYYENFFEREPCVVCGSSQTIFHHIDYESPEKVVYLCQKHHVWLHRGKLDKEKIEKKHVVVPLKKPKSNIRHPIKDILVECEKSCADLAREAGISYPLLNRHLNNIFNLSAEDKAKVDRVLHEWTNRASEIDGSGKEVS